MSQRALTLHHSAWQGVLYVTGGGSQIISELLTTPGASRTVLEVAVPYAAAALAELLGEQPEQACSASTARKLAMAAYQRARRLGDEPSFGLGCTASLATDREKRGAQRAHVAIQTADTTYSAELALAGDRGAQEELLLGMMWHGLDQTLDLHGQLVEAPAALTTDTTHALEHWRALILDEAHAFATGEHDGKLLMPGAFNPLHHAHVRMLEIAQATTNLPGAFELSIVNVDKPLLDYTEIERRLAQFTAPVWLTRLPTFVEKARHFPGAHFVVGLDTVVRLVDTKYYGSAAGRDAAIDELVDLGSRFVVFGREHRGAFRALDDVTLPRKLRDVCTGIPQVEFHEPVSSTALRNATP